MEYSGRTLTAVANFPYRLLVIDPEEFPLQWDTSNKPSKNQSRTVKTGHWT